MIHMIATIPTRSASPSAGWRTARERRLIVGLRVTVVISDEKDGTRARPCATALDRSSLTLRQRLVGPTLFAARSWAL